MKVLGFDPGTASTGYGIVLFEQGRLCLMGCGVLRPPATLELADKLDFLFTGALRVLEDCGPAAVSVETVFAAKNVSSTVKLAHARGVLLAAAARCGVPVFEYEPRLVKKALVGYGNAEKHQVRAMVLSLLARQRSRIPLDAADALAVAICHVHAGPWAERRKA
ncbi:MAG TPA: crossover junction endodeoxyribonuclease RuvC [Thermoanaerobaculia bacterium]|nr:crossover junction endodeoxyribonuclease RuvC [Thermoanaerobaculia bacterium]